MHRPELGEKAVVIPTKGESALASSADDFRFHRRLAMQEAVPFALPPRQIASDGGCETSLYQANDLIQ